MLKARHMISAVCSVVLISISVSSPAQVVDVSGCRAIEDRLERFDCYETLEAADQETSRQGASSETRPAQPAPAASPPAIAQPARNAQPAPAAPAATAANQDIDNFGKEDSGAELIEGKDGKTEMVDIVASVEHRLPTQAVITLKSGQKWIQTVDKPYRLQPGDEVRIYPTRFGSDYRLTATRISGFIQVARLQ